MANKVWFITGASRGFGRIWAEAALARGDKVAATARDAKSIGDLKERFGDAALPISLDVTNPTQVQSAIKQAHDYFGRLDIVLNNAGYSLVGTIEEASEAEVRALFDTNVFGNISVIKAVLPILRAQQSGHIIGVTSGLGIEARPLIGLYCTTKWAVEGLHDSLSQEVAKFGIKVSMIEPGAYATDFASDASLKRAAPIEVYDDLRQRVMAGLANQKRGNPQATPEAIFKLVDSDNPPLRLALGSTVLPVARECYAERIATWEAWEEISNAAQGE
ncbi:MAG: SDR family NAD(P)-dependent oxidoreductase [Pseudoxanthomonas sp.]|nr:SDR family NAD(P)-dependent oxidoreductase [Pseudoxanthomonas sp.]